MKKLIVIGLMVPLLCHGLVMDAAAADKKASASAKPPGYQAAETLSLLTGVAISPLLGVGAVGAYTYFKADENQRQSLSWYAQPWFWVGALLLVGLVAAKDLIGTAAPTALKKPLDVAEAFENKVSGLVAAGAFVPMIATFFPTGGAQTAEVFSLSAMGFAAMDTGGILNILMIPLSIAIFAIVWLASHAINILILISPFTTVDTALKSFRIGILSLVAGTSQINPYLGALLSVFIIVLSYLIAGWSFRLTVVGWAFMWDSMTFRRARFAPAANGNWMFTACSMNQTPIRTYGRLVRDEAGKLVFEYRPWLFLAKKTLPMPEGKYAVGTGLFYPEIVQVTGDEGTKSVFALPPRYMTHETELARAYGLPQCDIGLLKGFKAIWKWLKGLFGMRGSEMVVPAATA